MSCAKSRPSRPLVSWAVLAAGVLAAFLPVFRAGAEELPSEPSPEAAVAAPVNIPNARPPAPGPGEGCTAVVDFISAPGEAASGRIAADMTARILRERPSAAVLDPRDVASFLEAQLIAVPRKHDPASMVALGKVLGTGAVLDGMVMDYYEEEDRAVVEVAVRLLDTETQKVMWEGSGRATDDAVFRVRRATLPKVLEKALRSALFTLSLPQGGPNSCPALAAIPLVRSAVPQQIVVQAPNAVREGPVQIVRTFVSKGVTKSVDLAEVRVLYFNTGVFSLSPGMLDFVKEIATILTENPDLGVLIVGHSDADPGQNENSNFALSMRRAQAAYESLRSQGADPNRLVVKALGQTAPVAPNDSKFNKTLNRRVEFKFLTGLP